jgi:uncharacterized protein YecE (DUF72 family)
MKNKEFRKTTGGSVYIGTSGWNYKHWANGIFYPPGLNQKEWLNYFYKFFNTVEINYTFYRLPSKQVFKKWQDSVPEGFRFIIKANRFITHVKRLKDPESSVRNFLENTSGLGKKLGPILFQLPPSWNVNLERLDNFLRYLTSQKIIPELKAALELRNASWAVEETYNLLKTYNIALCFADWPDLIIEQPVTADFVYIRRHGPGDLYSSCYSEKDLDKNKEQIKDWLKQVKEVYVYFNNDWQGYAVKNALTLLEMMKNL